MNSQNEVSHSGVSCGDHNEVEQSRVIEDSHSEINQSVVNFRIANEIDHCQVSCGVGRLSHSNLSAQVTKPCENTETIKFFHQVELDANTEIQPELSVCEKSHNDDEWKGNNDRDI